MAIIDFPHNPDPDDEHQHGDGKWVYDGHGWVTTPHAGGAGIDEPVGAGTFGRTPQGEWQNVLPLVGGTMDTVTGTVGGIIIPVNDDLWNRPGIRMNVSDGRGIEIDTTGDVGAQAIHIRGGSGSALDVANNSFATVANWDLRANWGGVTVKNQIANTVGFYAETGNVGSKGALVRIGAGSTGLVLNYPVNSITAGTSLAFQRYSANAGTTVANAVLGNIIFQGKAIQPIDNPPHTSAEIIVQATQAWNATSAGTQVIFRTTANNTATPQNVLTLEHSGTVRVGSPSGPAVTGAGNVNASAYFINGVPLAADFPGIADAPFLPMKGGELTPLQDMPSTNPASGHGITIRNQDNWWEAWPIELINEWGQGCLHIVNPSNVSVQGAITCDMMGSGTALLVNATGSASGINIIANSTGRGLRIAQSGAGVPVEIGTSTEWYLRVANDGALIVGNPTGPAVTGQGNLNLQGGVFVNGQPLVGGATVSATAPTNPVMGQQWFDEDEANTYVWIGNAWVVAVNPPGIAGATVGAVRTFATGEAIPVGFWINRTIFDLRFPTWGAIDASVRAGQLIYSDGTAHPPWAGGDMMSLTFG